MVQFSQYFYGILKNSFQNVLTMFSLPWIFFKPSEIEAAIGGTETRERFLGKKINKILQHLMMSSLRNYDNFVFNIMLITK